MTWNIWCRRMVHHHPTGILQGLELARITGANSTLYVEHDVDITPLGQVFICQSYYDEKEIKARSQILPETGKGSMKGPGYLKRLVLSVDPVRKNNRRGSQTGIRYDRNGQPGQ